MQPPNLCSTSDLCLRLQPLLCATVLSATLRGLLCLIQRLESLRSPSDTLNDEDQWDHNPEAVHQNKVSPVVVCFRAGVCSVKNVVVENACRVVQDVAVELAERNNNLKSVPEGVICRNQAGGEEGERAPESL